MTLVIIHTSLDSFYKWTKISSLEINIFGFKNDGEKWARFFHFGILLVPSELLLPSAKNLSRKAELALQISRYL